MTSNVSTLAGLVFLLVFFVFMFSQLSTLGLDARCPEYFTVNRTLNIVDYLGIMFNARCSAIPVWVQFLVYVPILIAIARAIVSVSA
jgi:hypothetical protein